MITVSTDIYSLGAILYELLAEARAQPVDFDTPTRIQRAICEVDVPRPSLLARGLPSDLDEVVLMALRKDPKRRYKSAEQFATDVRHSPIRARRRWARL